jgi:hypothetical protein
MDDLYEQWNDVAEGFGVDKEEANEIFSILQETLDMPKKPLASITELLFDVYDTDNVRVSAIFVVSCLSLCGEGAFHALVC